MNEHNSLYIGNNLFSAIEGNKANSKFTKIDGNDYYMISDVDEMPPFFMSIVSDSNHWMFLSSNGGITAGRKNADFALFPYYTDDKITESSENTGSKTILLVDNGQKQSLWEPLSNKYEGVYHITRNLYKNIYGNSIIFEEINHDLGLSFSYQWCVSNLYGFIRKSKLINLTDRKVSVSILDGIQNILPYGVACDLQNSTSNLVDAYKRSELIKTSGLGIYALSAIIVDKAEPSEALKANIAWSLGLENANYLLSTRQLRDFRSGLPIEEELDVKAEKGAYLVNAQVELESYTEKQWMIIANVNQTYSSIVGISQSITSNVNLWQLIDNDINEGTGRLIALIAASDGLQLTADKLRNGRHFSNTLFNVMRGGIFDNNYQIEQLDFYNYLAKANCSVFKSFENTIKKLPPVFSYNNLKEIASQQNDVDFYRLSIEYMPLKFSRRHGDPSRPWNKFSINTHNELDGSKILDYEGNWRDIFQNWEALSLSYPGFIESMILKFLNASTFDGYNPYRITKDGFDWETIEPDNPWSYIGYWGDHQIIYLLKLLEQFECHNPEKLHTLYDKDIFVYANVPYQIKTYHEILENPKDTIVFDAASDHEIRLKKENLGADGALLYSRSGHIHHVNFTEKLLATLLSKLSNFIPEAGIWMNTQRPEWNDANNALVGNGVSMVTLFYLRRFLHFLKREFELITLTEIHVSQEFIALFEQIFNALAEYKLLLKGKINDSERKQILDRLAQAGSDYRQQIYQYAFTGNKQTLTVGNISNLITLSLEYIEHTIRANKRNDGLYHSYNLMTLVNHNEITISYLSEMLEGQVAVLSSGYLSSKEAIDLLNSLKKSQLFRTDQSSYILYPNRELPLFMHKNQVPAFEILKSELLSQLVSKGNQKIIEKDINGCFHFNGNFKNASDLRKALTELSDSMYSRLVEKDKELVLAIFEKVFNHKAFTGRSGTFFGYEGLGSIYWHMVSKLQLAVLECCQKAISQEEGADVINNLIVHYYEINEGIGVHKSPRLYGAFPTDPYSHTPAGKGAKQPGMTGQVKEDLLSRFGELGVSVNNGMLVFAPYIIRKNEFISQPTDFNYVDINLLEQKISLEKDSLAFTYCQVPVVYKLSDKNKLSIKLANGLVIDSESFIMDNTISQKIFERTGEVVQIELEWDNNS